MTEPDVTSQDQRVPATKGRRRLRNAGSALLLLSLLIWLANYLLISRPIGSALATDSRNDAYKLASHYRYYLDPSTLVLDLRRVDAAAPVDLWRGLFQSAQALHEAGRSFSRVVLARSGSTVFMMDGSAFDEMGAAYGGGENPVYLIRTLPGKLNNPDGSPAFSTWTGGLLGVTLRQMQEANDAAAKWAQGL